MKKLFLICLFSLLSTLSYASSLYYPYQILEFDYNFLDSKRYDAMKLKLTGSTSVSSGNFTYKFSNVKPTNGRSLTNISLGYSQLVGNSWFGASLVSESDKPFGRADLLDFDIFYTYKILDSQSGVITYPDGSKKPNYYRLYFGITYSTFLSFAENFPMPVLRFEYESHALSMILGYPLNYIRWRMSQMHSLELQYIPIIEFLASYNITFNSFNTFSLQFQIENDRYRLSAVGPRTFTGRIRYFEEYYWVRLKYSLNVKNVVKIAPYIQFLVDGKQYLARDFFSTRQHIRNTGFGYSLGTTIAVSF